MFFFGIVHSSCFLKGMIFVNPQKRAVVSQGSWIVHVTMVKDGFFYFFKIESLFHIQCKSYKVTHIRLLW